MGGQLPGRGTALKKNAFPFKEKQQLGKLVMNLSGIQETRGIIRLPAKRNSILEVLKKNSIPCILKRFERHTAIFSRDDCERFQKSCEKGESHTALTERNMVALTLTEIQGFRSPQAWIAVASFLGKRATNPKDERTAL